MVSAGQGQVTSYPSLVYLRSFRTYVLVVCRGRVLCSFRRVSASAGCGACLNFISACWLLRRIGGFSSFIATIEVQIVFSDYDDVGTHILHVLLLSCVALGRDRSCVTGRATDVAPIAGLPAVAGDVDGLSARSAAASL